MKTLTREQGFTLLEVLISAAILSIGALGVLGLVTTSIQMNGMSRNFSEASLVAQWKADRIQVLSAADPDITNCGGGSQAAVCRSNGLSRVIGSPSALTLAEIAGRPASGNRYQLTWQVAPMAAPNLGLRAVQVTVYWPKNRDLLALGPTDPGFVDCVADDFSAGGRCKKLVFNNYRR